MDNRQDPGYSGLNAIDDLFILDNLSINHARLRVQDRLFSDYIRANAKRLVGENISSILDLGCGVALRGLVFRSVYAGSHMVGIDKDVEAISRAQEEHEADLTNVDLVVGDIEEITLQGSFDLVYTAHVLIHTSLPDRVVQLAYDSLRLGGYIWVKEHDPDSETKYEDEAYQELLGLVQVPVSNPEFTKDMPGLLQGVGFTDIRVETEDYPIGGPTAEGKVTLALMLGRFYNARYWLEDAGIPKSYLKGLCTVAAEEALRDNAKVGIIRAINTIARRPPI